MIPEKKVSFIPLNCPQTPLPQVNILASTVSYKEEVDSDSISLKK